MTDFQSAAKFDIVPSSTSRGIVMLLDEETWVIFDLNAVANSLTLVKIKRSFCLTNVLAD